MRWRPRAAILRPLSCWRIGALRMLRHWRPAWCLVPWSSTVVDGWAEVHIRDIKIGALAPWGLPTSNCLQNTSAGSIPLGARGTLGAAVWMMLSRRTRIRTIVIEDLIIIDWTRRTIRQRLASRATHVWWARAV